jgi:serine/threonine protein kinase
MVKRYIKKDEYRQEVKNFSSSRHSESIIRFHGSYIHGDSYNILLEFADKGSLEEYFQKQTPPSRGRDIIKFWDSLFQLIKALKTIHSFLGSVKYPTFQTSYTNLSSGHRDVKPASVYVLSYGAESAFDWKFKLADFGLGQFMGKATSEGGAIPKGSRGTQTYGV